MSTKLWTPERPKLKSGLLQPFAYTHPQTGKKRILFPDGREMSRTRALLECRDEIGAMQTGMFANPLVNCLSQSQPLFNFTSTHIKTALFHSTTPLNLDDTVANCAWGAGAFVSGNEVSGTNYSLGGRGDGAPGSTFMAATIANATSPYPGGVTFSMSSAACVWTNATITDVAGALIYVNGSSVTPNNAAFCFVYFGQGYSATAQNFSITWNAAGVWVWITR